MFTKITQIISLAKVCKTNRLLLNINNCFHSKINKNKDIERNVNTNNAKNGLNAFVFRSHTCGQLSTPDVGQRVRLCGWIQYQRFGKFVTLRDSYGITQLIVDNKQLQRQISQLMPESVVEVCGLVSQRPQSQINPELKTGTIEVIVDEMNVWNNCRKDIPFIIRDFNCVNEKSRLEFRYIDLRHDRMQYNLRLRSQVVMKMRQFLMDKYGFVEVETPTLFKKTPGGAQEYVVPTQFANSFYSLVQSPQQFKQLLMVGGLDRYFQIARCYRDEGTRPDRQPEFTQLDLEMSFTTSDGIMSLIEQLLEYCWPHINDNIVIPFRRMKYSEAMRDYGSDKPDLRSDIKLKEIPEINNSDMNSIDISVSKPFCVTLVIPEVCAELWEKIKSLIEELSTIQNQLKFKGKLFHSGIKSEFNQNFALDSSSSLKNKIANQYQLRENDLLWIAIGEKDEVYRLMGRIRANCVQMIEDLRELNDENNKLSFVWIVDFPLFVAKEDSHLLESTHHPFTSPKSTDYEILYSNPEKALGEHFDLVLNGQEVGGGSIRIHDHRMQEYVLQNILKEDIDSMQYFLDALRSGCPPHGGIALGLDRLMSIICKTESIRDVMAFPKSAHGKDLMAGSPTSIPDSVKKLYHLS